MDDHPTRVDLGPVDLVVADRARSTAYYRDAIGLRVLAEEEAAVTLGADAPLVRLVEEPDARPAADEAGLFHLALLVPDRADLARWTQHAADERVPLEGASDHVVSEALYLRDPDGHGIEIYADRDRAIWDGRVQDLMTTLPLDLPDLLALVDPAAPFDGLPAATRMGHIHLQVSDLPASVAWYRDVLGLDLVATYGPQAAFLSSGGYHHHVGANTWRSAGAAPAGPGTARLLRAAIGIPESQLGAVVDRVRRAGGAMDSEDDAILVRDPSGIPLALVALP
jgi:catechol 2,3-dioxygenase